MCPPSGWNSESTDSSKITMVLLHGYLGSGALYYSILADLVEHFNLIMIDLIGFGGSTRPENFDKHGFTP